MSAELPERLRAEGVRAERAAPCWDVADSAPELLRRLTMDEPELPALLDALRSSLPVPDRFARSFHSGPYCRPPGHNRAFYMDMNDASTEGARGVLAFKGTEVAASNLGEMLGALDDRFDLATELPMLEWFPLVEQKVPGALLLDEARDEARAAAELQASYLAAHGRLAHTPVPLLVLAWPPETARTLSSELEPRLSDRAARTVRASLADGLGVYVYYYPTVPIRVRHVARHLAMANDIPSEDGRIRSYRARRAKLSSLTRPLEVVDAWIELVVEMLVLGFVPVTLSHQSVGQCVREQNAVVDGGFVDVDSLQRISKVKDDHELCATLVQTMRELSDTIAMFLADSVDGPRPGTRGVRKHEQGTAAHVVGPHVWMSVRDRLRKKRDQGASIDPRVAAVLMADDAVASLDGLLDTMFPGVRA